MGRNPFSGAILPRDRQGAARAVASFLLAGGVFITALMLFVDEYGGETPLEIGATISTAVLAGAAGALCWWRPDWVPAVFWVAAPIIAILIIGGLDLLTSDASAGAQLFFLWPVLYAATFLRGPYIYLVLVLVAGAEATVVYNLRPFDEATSDAIGLMTALSMATVIIVTLRGRIDRLVAATEAMALADPLTGLPNRRAFDDDLARAVARAQRTGQALSLLTVDVDHFKSINDTWGHAAGDAALCAVAVAMRTASRSCDVVARRGGDEFAMIVDSDSVGARLVARRLREVVAADAGGPAGPPTLSIGVATLPDHADSAETLLAASDTALYNAKANGRDGVALPHPTTTPTT